MDSRLTEQWASEVRALKDEIMRRQYRITELERALVNLKTAFRVNMLRCHPSISHAEIDAAIEAAITLDEGTCIHCGAAARPSTRHETFPYGAGEDYALLHADVTVWSCEACGEQWTLGDAEIAREAAIRKHLEEKPMQKHFVTFLSPGTFFAEYTTKPIDSWDIETAVDMAKDIYERYNARPYGFRFSTQSRGDDDLDSVRTLSSGIYYLRGKIETIDEVRARNDPQESILLSNMEHFGYDRIITSIDGWKWTQPLLKDDVVLDVMLPPSEND